MKKVAKVILSVLTTACLLALCLVVGTVYAVTVPVYFLCALVLGSFAGCVALTKSAIAWARDSVGLPHNKEVVFRIEPDSPNGIKLSDIASGRCSEYKGVDLRDALREYAFIDQGKGKYVFPAKNPVCFVSNSGQHFLGHLDTIYPVRLPTARPAHLFPPKKADMFPYCIGGRRNNSVDDRRFVHEFVLKTNFIVTGPRTNGVRLQYVGGSGQNFSRVRLITPSVVMSKTKGMTPIRVALLSPYVVRDDSKSVFLRRYIALARAGVDEDGRVSNAFEKDMRANMQQFTHICAYERGALSPEDMAFMRFSMNVLRSAADDRSSECSVAALEQHSRHMLLLLGLSQSEDEMFKPLTEASKVWLMSEFIHLQSFQDAMISAAMASMASSVDKGRVSREDVLRCMPYLCKQIPGFCEAIYTIVRAAKYNNGVCEEGNLGGLPLYNIARALNRHGVQLPDIDEDSAFAGMNDRAKGEFETFVEQISRACRPPDADDMNSMCGTGRRVLQDRRCSDAIACLIARRISYLCDSRRKPVDSLCTPATSDEFITNYIRDDPVSRGHVPERWVGLKLADRQELAIASDVDTVVYKFPGLVYPPVPEAGTSLDSSEVTAVSAESRATRPAATGAAGV
ncbi:hypothetical protein [Anaplasma marginale]